MRDPSRASAALGDVTKIALDLENDALIAGIVGQLDRLDCLVNNAGYALTGPFSSYTNEQIQRQLRVNVLGPALLTQALLPLLKRSQGRIINVSSLAGEAGMPMNSLYCASKHAIEGWSESLKHELAPHNMQVALVEPGGYRTGFASNMEWGRGVTIDSVDEQQLADYRAMRNRLLAGKGRDPGPVVANIVRLAELQTMPFRTRVGADAHFMRLVKRWLPEKIALRMIGNAFRRRMAAKDQA